MLKLLRNVALLAIVLVIIYLAAPQFRQDVGKITGNVVSEPCVDSDGGMDFYVFGMVKQGCTLIQDCCRRAGVGPCVERADVLVETYCSNQDADIFLHQCTFGCAHGACAESDGTTRDSFVLNPGLLQSFRLPPNCTAPLTDVRELVPSLECNSAGCIAKASVKESAQMLEEIVS